MYFVHKVDDTVFLAEFVFCVDENETHFCGYFRASPEKGLGVGFELFVIFAAYESRSYDFFLGDVLVMSFGGFRCRSDERLGEFLVLDHAFRHLHSADGAFACLVFPPGMA